MRRFSLTLFVPLGTKILCRCILKNRFLGTIQRDLKLCSNYSSTLEDFTQIWEILLKIWNYRILLMYICVRVCVCVCSRQRNKQTILTPAVIPYLCHNRCNLDIRQVPVQYHGQVLYTWCMRLETTYSESAFCYKKPHIPASGFLY